jgi:SAM-dependent methyltransferase
MIAGDGRHARTACQPKEQLYDGARPSILHKFLEATGLSRSEAVIGIRCIVRDVPDQIFADPRLAQIYDEIEGNRTDLDHYEDIVDEIGARSVIDIGCGTGVLGCRLARRGITVVGVDPAQASLAVARKRPMADRVTWLLADATTLPPMVVDAVTMTGNVAQIFVHDDEWHATLSGIREVLRDDGHLVFETRDPSFRGWDDWTRDRSISITETVAGRVEHWVELTHVEPPLVAFRHSFHFLDNGDIVSSDSTLRFRNRDEITTTLALHGFTVDDVRDAPDRPGREFVFIARAV